MANISELNLVFEDGTTLLNANRMNAIVGKINDIVRELNGGSSSGGSSSGGSSSGGSSSVTPVVPTMMLNTSAKTVALSAPSGLSIKYSANGGTPATNYSSAINVSNGATVKAITTNGTTSSSVPKITVKFNEELNTIQFSSSQTGDIVYTTDGSTPNASSTQYSGEITPSVGTTYKVAVYNNGVLASEVATIQIAS